MGNISKQKNTAFVRTKQLELWINFKAAHVVRNVFFQWLEPFCFWVKFPVYFSFKYMIMKYIFVIYSTAVASEYALAYTIVYIESGRFNLSARNATSRGSKLSVAVLVVIDVPI